MASFSEPQSRLEMHPPPLRTTQGPCPIWSGLGTRPVGFWLLGSRLAWYGVHWIDDRGVPCLSSMGRCRQCEDGWLPRRVAYICAMRGDTGGRYLLRISEYAYRHCPVMAIMQDWAGTAVVVRRLADRKNAPWRIDVPPATPPRPVLPPAVDVLAVLTRVWAVDLRRLAEDPPEDGDATTRLRPYPPVKLPRRRSCAERRIHDV